MVCAHPIIDENGAIFRAVTEDSTAETSTSEMVEKTMKNRPTLRLILAKYRVDGTSGLLSSHLRPRLFSWTAALQIISGRL